MTPRGSFQGSNRETCVRSGRSTSIPNWSTMYEASSGESAMFFGARGSMAGGQMYAGGSPGASSGTYCRRWKIAPSYLHMDGRRKSRTSRFGSDRSMWHRQIQSAVPLRCSTIPSGCGSCMTTKSYSDESNSSAFSCW
jgi:hypothetical protein